MQSINLLLIAVITAFGVPVLLLAFSAYTLYNTISVASSSKRRRMNMIKTVEMARKELEAGAT